MKFGPKASYGEMQSPNPMNLRIEFEPDPISAKSDSSIKKPFNHKAELLSREFIKKLKAGIFAKSLSKLSNVQSLVNFFADKSYIILDKKNEKLEKVKFWFEKNIPNLIIHPDNPLKIIWNVTLLLAMMVCFVYVPFQISFDLQYDFDQEMKYWIFILFLNDIILNFMTGDYVEGILEMHPRKISLNYLKKNLIFDLIALISTSLD